MKVYGYCIKGDIAIITISEAHGDHGDVQLFVTHSKSRPDGEVAGDDLIEFARVARPLAGVNVAPSMGAAIRGAVALGLRR